MRRMAFTLVELSIVLVILGLLVGGVLTGQSLIRAAELRSVATQYQGYVTAVMTFRDKYSALPGDMADATRYWGAADGSTGVTAGCSTTASSTTFTCNGNADGITLQNTGSQEQFRFWQHLANAGLVAGSYTGVSASGSNTYTATTANCPPGRLSNSLWFIFNWGTFSGDSYWFDGTYGNTFLFGAAQPTQAPYGQLMKPDEAYNLDVKMDDGMPGTGKMIVNNITACTTATSSSMLTATYLLNNPAVACTPLFPKPF